MIDDITERLERLLTRSRSARRAEKTLQAAAPAVLQALDPLIAEQPVTLDSAGAPTYHVKLCWWRLPHPAGQRDFHGFAPPRGTPGVTVADALCRDAYVLTCPDPSFELIDVNFATSMSCGADATEGFVSTPPNDFAYAADETIWSKVAFDLEPLLDQLESSADRRLSRALAGLDRVRIDR